jgi:hypothetical protein
MYINPPTKFNSHIVKLWSTIKYLSSGYALFASSRKGNNTLPDNIWLDKQTIMTRPWQFWHFDNEILKTFWPIPRSRLFPPTTGLGLSALLYWEFKKKSNCTNGKKTLPNSLDYKFHPILTHHDKDNNTSWCKEVKLD